jgi:uncharacterized membrane protein
MTWFFIALMSSWLSAFAAITQKKVLFELNPVDFSFLLSIFNLLFSLPFFLFIDYGTINYTNLAVLFLKAIIGAASFLCVMTSLKNLQISTALPLLALTPGFVAIVAFVFLGESLKTTEVIGLISLIIGTYILESKNLKEIFFPFKVFVKSKHHHYVLLALMLFTISSVMDKFLLIRLNLTPVSLIAVQHFFFALLFSVVILSRKGGFNSIKSINKKNYAWIAAISILTIGYRFTHIWAVSIASVALTLAIKRTSVLWATTIGGKIFKDSNLFRKTIAVVFILIGALLILRW